MVAHSVVTKRKVEVLLQGQRFTIRSDRDDIYIERLSRLVNDQLDDIKRNTRTLSGHHIALLAALNIADELIRTRELLAKAEELQALLRQKAQASLKEVDCALAFLPVELRGQDDKHEHSDSHAQSADQAQHSPKIA
jgi:cell division protein ZapA (FtsZ GTPase activity inhibitor)